MIDFHQTSQEERGEEEAEVPEMRAVLWTMFLLLHLEEI